MYICTHSLSWRLVAVAVAGGVACGGPPNEGPPIAASMKPTFSRSWKRRSDPSGGGDVDAEVVKSGAVVSAATLKAAHEDRDARGRDLVDGDVNDEGIVDVA